ncbi:hypothetical protein SCHPADRAFT_998761 [Schizopora paradoxa]|uniref:mRNA decay factor PAT1 domain-containing protein n=1 Tax=Schizopora paradoxa TaxID=27342 RepID=A0A0H2RI12_9AGAM|nr:hypothetical protein SCHPADRAFT_998761 [Schizopora paradoxa]
MSFFGFENKDLEEEKRRFLAGDLPQDEDIAVYNWGSEDYEGLGNALQEGGDDFNDETFGGTGPVGKDFDFTAQALSDFDKPTKPPVQPETNYAKEHMQRNEPMKLGGIGRQTSKESIWDDKSPFSVLRGATGSLGRKSGLGYQSTASTSQSKTLAAPESEIRHSSSLSQVLPSSSTTGIKYATTGIKTVQEIEAEMIAKSQRLRAQAAQAAAQAQADAEALQARARAQAEAEARNRAQAEAEARARAQAEAHAQLLAQQRQQQQQHQQQMRPPRMHSQSPSTFVRLQPQTQAGRVHSPNLAYQQNLLEQQEQMRLEELERQLREQMYLEQDLVNAGGDRALLAQLQQQQRRQALTEQRQLQEFPNDFQRFVDQPPDIQALLQSQKRQQSPMRRGTPQQQLQQQLAAALNGGRGQGMPQNLHDVQLQQRLLAQLAHEEFSHTNVRNQEVLRAEAMRKIMETERLEGKRRRKAAKLAHMARYNDLMTQSDKDFITRIQVSQLVTSDPYTEDFYAQVYGSLIRSRMGLDVQGKRVLEFGALGGVGLGVNQKVSGRRQNAMQRMEAQVERIVNAARQREKDKSIHAIHSLQGALGKTAGRSYKAAPRQLLQVDGSGSSDSAAPHPHGHISREDAKESAAGAAKEAAKIGREALGNQSDGSGVIRKDPLTRRQTLLMLEGLYDILLKLEQMRRDQPAPTDEIRLHDWEILYAEEIQKLWDGLQIMVPLETSDPHPFISLLQPAKGKRLVPRLTRHLSSQQMLTVLTLLIACFQQLDVVIGAPLLDATEKTDGRDEMEKQTETFLSTVLQGILPVIAKASLRLVGGLLGLLMERCVLQTVVMSRPGLSLLTAFLSRVEVIKSDMIAGTITQEEIPTETDLVSWQNVYDHLFDMLAPHLQHLFPSYRILYSPEAIAKGDAANADVPRVVFDILDQPVWKFLATLSLPASNEQQQILVASLREMILNNIAAVNMGLITDPEEEQLKLTNVNVLLHALGLDSAQIPL